MKAVYYEQHGGPEVLQVGELPVPEPGPDQVLVKVAAAAVNPIDRRLRGGELQEYIQRTFPVVPGWDFSGRIEQVGVNVSGWAPGDEVMGLAFTWAIQHGTYAEYVPVDVSAIAAKPESIPFHEAAALPLVSLTAWQSLAEYGEVQAGQNVLIQAGAGGVGSAAIPMAKHLGATVYTTCSGRNAEYVKSRGADFAIDYATEDYVQYLKNAVPDGLDLVLEALITDEAVRSAIHLARPGGTVVYMNNEPPDMPEIEAKQIKTQFLHHRADGAMLAELAGLYAGGSLPLPPVDVRDLTEAADAHAVSEAGHTQGKVVLHIQDL